ncbi:hypothetical protein CNMCM8689_001906 [Aspergillus fumigatus]|uniref:Uncharacterized protein n=1 Tax=Aspergillus fumigatus (strain CBS 144.89 / FGSC A1163 / CEA10) TaxID=451804 RepID=B0Y184_ASPFC|nr:hypothetical protein AFUB_049030 [Aspergillus fumigatus A1163]KAF4286777.1 hypothetical protein CNMCM8689_001906 [Aspergillus fumigatus]KAJ8199104.1 hypothetical protein LV161_000755 [Aspergillus fumigatus]KAJ8203478.1 hypothetical protein LV158_007677 [Aspergillus fumigatus]
MVDVDALNSELDQISDQYQSLFRRLNSESQRDVQTVALSLSIALSQLYQLAIFVRGDYNKRVFNVSGILVTKVREAFEQLAHASTTALENVSTLQSENVDLLAAKMHIFEQNVKAAHDETAAKIAGYKDAISMIVPIWGIIGLIDHTKSPGSVLLEGQIGAARQAVDNAPHILDSAYRNAQASLDLLRGEQAKLELQSVILKRLGPLQSAIQSAITKAQELEKGLIPMKDSATEMVRRRNKLSSRAEDGAELSITKEESVSGILDVVELAIVEPNTAKQIKMILAELRNSWGPSPVPPAILSRLDELDGKAAKIAG